MAIFIGTPNDDTYFVTAGDVVLEAPNQGYDSVYVISQAITYSLTAGSHVELLGVHDQNRTESINLTGNELAQYISGNRGRNILDGGGGADILYGRQDDDTYYVDGDDTVIDFVGEGFDIVYARSSFVLSAGAAIEVLATVNEQATTAIDLTGNELDNYITGNAGMNRLDGGPGGSDTLWGRDGDDSYFVDDIFDSVVEMAGQGNDVVYARGSYTLGAGQSVEVLATANNFATTAINLTGNEADNYLVGNFGANILDGGSGADQLWGREGDDSYFVDGNDVVVEYGGHGRDTVYARSSHTLSAGFEIEVLGTADNTATTAINLKGNELANYVTGNAGTNLIDGGAGSDYLEGRGGADVFAFTTTPGSANVDVIADFAPGADKIGLDDAIFAGIGTPGSFNANAFVAGSAAADADDRIIYNQANGQLLYDADGNGAGQAVLFAIVSGAPALGAGDFAVI